MTRYALVVEPGRRRQALTCQLKHLSLEAEVSYEAISYALGDPTPTHIISLQIGDVVSDFGVTKNLQDALHQFRSVEKRVFLWIDALCINQMDIAEKSAQVMRMTEIYGRAKHVFIWLVVADNMTDRAISYLGERLDKDVIKLRKQDREGIELLEILLRNPWFRRRWIIQEIAFAKDASIFCGKSCLPWKDFADGFVMFTRLLLTESDVFYIGEDFNQTGANTLIYVSNNIFHRDSTGQRVIHWLVPIESLLQRLSQFEATDSRDIVYALLALGKDTYASKAISVDYTKPVWEVYRDVIAHVVGQTKSLDIICRPWALVENGMPSWIQSSHKASFGTEHPGVTTRMNADTLVGETGRSPYRACGTSIATTASSDFIHLREASDILLADGFIIDEIRTCGEIACDGKIPLSWLKIGGWKEQTSSPPQTFWRTLVADLDDKGENPPHWYSRICQRVFADTDSDYVLRPSVLNARHRDSPMALEFIKRIHATTWNRRFGKTAINKALGVFPTEAQEGDLVCILYGCSVPVLIRRQPVDVAQANDERPQRPLGIHIEPYLTQLRNLYAKQGAAWDEGMDNDLIFYAEEDRDQKLLESYNHEPVRRSKANVKTATDNVKGNKTFNIGSSCASERLGKIDFKCALVGECFMYGVMDGEAIELTRSGGVEPIIFGIGPTVEQTVTSKL